MTKKPDRSSSDAEKDVWREEQEEKKLVRDLDGQ